MNIADINDFEISITAKDGTSHVLAELSASLRDFLNKNRASLAGYRIVNHRGRNKLVAEAKS